MTQPELDTTALHERISESIGASIAAEAADRNLIKGLNVEEADFCLGVVSDQVLEILARQRQAPHAYDEDQRILEQHTQQLRGKLTHTLVHLVTERELSLGATPEEAKATADAHNRSIFDEYLKKRDAIDSSDA
jgi:hypothetical protein